jgi:hypothetical protein
LDELDLFLQSAFALDDLESNKRHINTYWRLCRVLRRTSALAFAPGGIRRRPKYGKRHAFRPCGTLDVFCRYVFSC